MIESNLVEGKQSIGSEMVYGKSVTDACLGWDDTEALLERLHAMF
jgi:3-deoxy-7-phosphoheptulonate synthase